MVCGQYNVIDETKDAVVNTRYLSRSVDDTDLRVPGLSSSQGTSVTHRPTKDRDASKGRQSKGVMRVRGGSPFCGLRCLIHSLLTVGLGRGVI
jgi:hypothetical protein